MKQIKQEQIEAILTLLKNYNVGIKDFLAVQTLFEKLPEVKEETK